MNVIFCFKHLGAESHARLYLEADAGPFENMKTALEDAMIQLDNLVHDASDWKRELV